MRPSGTSNWAATGIQSIFLRQAAGTGNYEIDEIRAGETWASVTPGSAASCVTYNTIAASACNSYALNNQTYTTSGTYVQTLANANAAGCDSIINFNLTINNANSSTLNIINCGPYTLNNQTYSASGAYTQLTQNVAGCDSTINLNLTIVGSLTYYQDLDNDGYGNAAVSQTGCAAITGYVTNSSDCNDNNNAIYPGAVDIAGNGIDEDCNGFDAPLQLGIYQFAATVDCATQDVAATNTSTNWTFSDFAAQGTACASGGGIFNRSGWNQTAILDLNQYNEFSITGANCSNLNLSKLALNHRTSSTGGTPTIFVRSSLDNYAVDIDTIASSWNGNVVLADTVILPATFANVSSVTFRFYVINQATATSTLRMDNVSVWGNAISITPSLFYADADGDGFGNPEGIGERGDRAGKAAEGFLVFGLHFHGQHRAHRLGCRFFLGTGHQQQAGGEYERQALHGWAPGWAISTSMPGCSNCPPATTTFSPPLRPSPTITLPVR